MDSSADLDLRELLNGRELQNVNLKGSFSDSFSPARAYGGLQDQVKDQQEIRRFDDDRRKPGVLEETGASQHTETPCGYKLP